MGGVGSGRSYRIRRPRKGWKMVAEAMPKLDISKAVKCHKAVPGVYTCGLFEFSIENKTIHFKGRDGLGLITKSIEISAMPCHLGGERYFGICPSCSKRYKILYLFKGCFACRRCLRLSYLSQNLTMSTRLLLKRNVVKKKINDDPWNKPKWMRKKTFKALRTDYFDLDEKEQIAWFFSLRNAKSVDAMFKRYGCSIIAGEIWWEECMTRGVFHPRLLPLYDFAHLEALFHYHDR